MASVGSTCVIVVKKHQMQGQSPSSALAFRTGTNWSRHGHLEGEAHASARVASTATRIEQPSTVVLISFAFHPSEEIGARRTTALARFLAEQGIRVVVVSAFGEQLLAGDSEIFPGVIAVPVKRPRRPWLDLLVMLKRRATSRGAQGTRQPALSADESDLPSAPRSLPARLRERYFRVLYFIDQYKKWSWRAAKAAARAGRKHGATAVLVSGPPHSALLAGAWAARTLGVPFIADMRDPWSDAVAAAGLGHRLELRVSRAVESWVLRRAAAVTATSAKAAALLVARDPSLAERVHVVRNGFDGNVASPLRHTGGRLSILYAGVLYVRRTPYPLLEALERLLSRPEVDATRVQLTFMGEKLGNMSEQALRRWLQGKRSAAVVRLLPRQDEEVVVQEVARATVMLNLSQQQQLQVPAKTFEQLAQGREILLIAEEDCETAQVTAGIRGVTRVDQSDANLLDEVLLDLYHRHVVAGRACVPSGVDVRRFARSFSHQHFRAILRTLAPVGSENESRPHSPGCGCAA